MKSYFLLIIILFFSAQSKSQKSTQANLLFQQAKADTLSKKDSLGSIHFYQSAKEELKLGSPDYSFAAHRLLDAAQVRLLRLHDLQLAHDYYYEALDAAHKANDQPFSAIILKQLGVLYDESKDTYDIFKFPHSANMETLEAYFSIISKPEKNNNGKLIIKFNGGSNDGVYEGSEGFIYGKYSKEIKNRENVQLGNLIVTHVYPNSSVAEVSLVKSGTPFFDVQLEDMAKVPIRFPKKTKKDVFLEVSLLNIKFVDDYREWIAHPRTLMYYPSPQIEKDVYTSMKERLYETYDRFHDDTSFYIPIKEGRFKGKNMMEALRLTKENDLKAFFSFIISYPGKYMGGTWKISETYATWLINNSPLGAGELMDSLMGYYNNDRLFNNYQTQNQKAIKENFTMWLIDAENFSRNQDFESAKNINDVLEKFSTLNKNDSLLAEAFANKAYINSDNKNDSIAIIYYQKAIDLFKKSGNNLGASNALNNIGSIFNESYRYTEAQSYFEKALLLRLSILSKDSSNEIKIKVARGHLNIGLSLFKQSKYKEAIREYIEGAGVIKNLPELNAKINLASLYSNAGKSYQKMGQYKEAADYYNLEYGIQKALGDEEAMADALDNKAYLLSLVGKNRESLAAYEDAFKLHKKTNNINDAGFTMSNIGQMLWTLGKFDSAIAAHNSAIELRVKANNKKGEASSWKKLGNLYKANGQPQKSIDAYNKALALYKTEDKEEYASLLEDFASNYSNVKDYANALKYYKTADSLYQFIGSKSKMADVQYNIATVYYNDNQYEQAESILESAINLQKEIRDNSGLLYSYIYKGLIQQNHYNNNNRALVFMKQALQFAEATTSESNIAYTKSNIGGLYRSIAMYDSAALYLDQALAAYQKLDAKSSIASIYINKGFLSSELVEYETAKKHFNTSLVIAKLSNFKNVEADALNGISQVEYLTGNFLKAIEINDAVMTLWKKEENPWGIAEAYLSLGNILNRQSEFTSAIANYRKADSMYSALKLEKSRATSLNNIGDIYLSQNDYEKSLPYFFQALQILQKTNDDRLFISLVKANIGEVYLNQKKYTDAEKWLKESLDSAKSIKNKRQIYLVDIVLGRLKTITKDSAAAKGFFEEAYSLLKDAGEKPVMVQLETEWGKWSYLNNDLINAEKHSQSSVALSIAMTFKTYIWKAYSTLANIREQQKNIPGAVIELEKSIKVVEELKSRLSGGEEAKKIFSSDESVVDLYQRMAKYLKMLGRNDEALAFIEKSNIENIKLRSNNDFANNNAEINEQKNKINLLVKRTVEELAKPVAQQNKVTIAKLEKMTTVAEADCQQYINDLVKNNKGRSDLLQIDAKQFKSERKHIDNDVALLSYLLTENELSVFIATKDTLLIKDIPIERKLFEQKIMQFYKLSKNGSTAASLTKRGIPDAIENKNDLKLSAEELSEELYGYLIAPAKEAIKNKIKIAIVPSGLLCFVPFQSLTVKDNTGARQYFGDEKQVFYVSKITTVTNKRNEKFRDFKIVAVGNADNSLENAETEAKSLLRIDSSAIVYVGNKATKKNVLGTLGEYNILHLATHGILDYGNAENSYLVFASDKTNGDDGKLKINDIYSIKDIDRFRMVTLSACETAVTQSIAEGWPISTASAFIEAGVSTVIATLWKVDDKATSLLMEKFYANMKNEKMDKVAALQKAQQFLKNTKEYADPYYWAPFQLVGLWQ